ncbi:hypothetical protein V8G61_02850 [Gaetbulibacter sp. M240]|uniref:hypothetical protein n=1 Tax=Gaetbulibacter sp. M240 TaxID=3126511 RepID=UPI00374F2A30
MRLKSYILIVLLAFIGVLSQHKNEVPNQEIVLQFHNDAIYSDDARITIDNIKAQLKLLGVSNIRLKDQKNGILRICYYSDKDVDVIKKTFSDEPDLDFDIAASSENQLPSDVPVKDQTLSYKLDIFEIQKKGPNHSDLNGVSISVLKLKTDSYFEQNKFYGTYYDGSCNMTSYGIKPLKPAFYVATFQQHLPQKTPQVRAGPLT